MTTAAEISKKAFDAVSVKITDAIHSASLHYVTQGVYDFDAGTYDNVQTDITGGRGVVDTVKPVSDVFPDYVVGPKDQLILLEGFSVVPQENWGLQFNGQTLTIKKVQDIVAAGTLFYVVAI